MVRGKRARSRGSIHLKNPKLSLWPRLKLRVACRLMRCSSVIRFTQLCLCMTLLFLLIHEVCPRQDTLQDYQEMFIQFGYVVLFSSAFPLAAMCALINNIIEIRSDALKLCTSLQRPFGRRVRNIGQWQVRVLRFGKCQTRLQCA